MEKTDALIILALSNSVSALSAVIYNISLKESSDSKVGAYDDPELMSMAARAIKDVVKALEIMNIS